MGIAVVAPDFLAVEIEDAGAVVEMVPVVVVERLAVVSAEGLGLCKLLDAERSFAGQACKAVVTVGAEDDGLGMAQPRGSGQHSSTMTSNRSLCWSGCSRRGEGRLI